MASLKTAKEKSNFNTYFFLILIAAVVIYFTNYYFPNGPFWDENYHIASAQKYINGVFFMEPHPPLGKLIIALGEKLINPNKKIDTSPFLSTDYVSNFPEGYSFAGMRFFPVLFACFSAVLFFLILTRLSVSIHYAFAFSSFFIFDNALIVHLRGAMLEGIQLFFILASVYYFLVLVQKDARIKPLEYFTLGLITGAALSVKLNSFIILILFIYLLWEDFGQDFIKLRFTQKNIPDFIIKCFTSAAGAVLVFFLVFYIHFAVAGHIQNGRTYMASGEYMQALNSGKTADPVYFFTMLRDYFAFINNYEKGVPKWDPAKVGENGSPALGWPFGYKSINYRWAKYRGDVAYLYLQGNPLIWFSSLFAFLMSVIFIGGVIFFKTSPGDAKNFKYIIYFTLLYITYMSVMMTIERVMYLYHYFIPLIFSMFLAFLIFQHYFREEMKSGDRILKLVSIVFFTEVFCVFLFYAPLSYFIPLDSLSFLKRAWLSVWQLVPVTY